MRRSVRNLALITAVVLYGVGMADPTAAGPSDCPRGFDAEPGLGCAKELPNGNLLIRHRSGFETQTHGGDSASGPLGGIAPERSIVCTASGSRSVAVYAHAIGSPNRLDGVRSDIQAAVRSANGLLAAAGAETGIVADYRFACDPVGQPEVSVISTAARDYDAIVDAARAAGMVRSNEDYWIFADFPSPNPRFAGVGTFHDDDALSATNDNYRNAGYGITYGGHWATRTPMHENGHNMGAVQRSAPDASGAGHCDGDVTTEVMCYDDGGPRWDSDHECGVVPAQLHYDACQNDYFNTKPAPGTYLATRHNIGANASWASFDNPFLAFSVPTRRARYTAVTPMRILDTRVGTGAPAARIGPGATVDLQVTGAGGVPDTGVTAVVMNVTAVDPTATSFLTAWPAGEGRPLASALNYAPGDVVPNLVMVKVGAGGRVSLYNHAGATHVAADVAGWYGDDAASTGDRYHAVTPTRILDTRVGTGAPAAKVGPGSTLDLQVAGNGFVPSSGATAVVLNVTAVDPTAASFLTSWPSGQDRPLTSNLNYGPGQIVPNLVVVKLGANGQVALYNHAGSTDITADVAGWYGGETAATTGGRYAPLTPARILDSRVGTGAPAVKVGPGATVDLQVTGRAGVPDAGVSAVVLNITAIDSTTSNYSYLTAWPAGESRPLASNLNYRNGRIVPNLVVVKVGALGKVSLYNHDGSAHLTADVAGWFTAD